MLSIGKAAATIGVATVTLRRWEKKGLITPLRTPENHRRYPLDQIEKLLADRCGDDDPKEEGEKNDADGRGKMTEHDTSKEENLVMGNE
ncbi:MAG: MerR family DNA-binding transcriptional regulator [Promethearchaeota archaeon]